MALAFLPAEAEYNEPPETADASPLTEILRRLMERQIASVRENFQRGGRPAKWKALAGGGPRHLYRTGALFNSLTGRSGTDFFEVFTRVRYAAAQHYGAVTRPAVTRKSKRYFWYMWYATGDDKWRAMALSPVGARFTVVIPPSPFMLFQKEDVSEITKKVRRIISDWTFHPAGTRRVRKGG